MKSEGTSRSSCSTSSAARVLVPIVGVAERQPPRLRRHRVHDLRIAMAEIAGEDARQPIDVGPTAVVGHPDALAVLEHERILGKGLHLGEVDHQVARYITGHPGI